MCSQEYVIGDMQARARSEHGASEERVNGTEMMASGIYSISILYAYDIYTYIWDPVTLGPCDSATLWP